jgi:hypothetical protein
MEDFTRRFQDIGLGDVPLCSVSPLTLALDNSAASAGASFGMVIARELAVAGEDPM